MSKIWSVVEVGEADKSKNVISHIEAILILAKLISHASFFFTIIIESTLYVYPRPQFLLFHLQFSSFKLNPHFPKVKAPSRHVLSFSSFHSLSLFTVSSLNLPYYCYFFANIKKRNLVHSFNLTVGLFI